MLGGDFKYVFFHQYVGMIPILTNIFQREWNHQLEWVTGVYNPTEATSMSFPVEVGPPCKHRNMLDPGNPLVEATDDICWWFRNPANSPADMVLLSHYLQVVGYMSGHCLGFLKHQQSWADVLITGVIKWDLVLRFV